MKKACISKTAAGLTGLLLLLSFAACGGQAEEEVEMSAMNTPPPEEPVLMEITVTAGETVLEGVLFDNETAQAVSAMLPLTVDLWHPAPGFARAFDLPEQIPDTAERTRNYERDGLAYWYEGPSVAIFYSDHLEQTIVEVVTIGRITSDISVFEEYGGSITITEKEE
mgnify:FL=1